MVDEQPEGEVARFGFRRVFGRRQLRIHYRSARVGFDWPDGDEGRKDLDRLVELLEELMKSAFQEMEVRDLLAGLDQDIEALLQKDCDDPGIEDAE